MESISAQLTQLLFLALLVALPFLWFFNRRRIRTITAHYGSLNFKSVPATEAERMLNTGRFTLLEKKWMGSGRTTELHIGRFENLDMAQFTLSQSDGSQAGRQQTVTFIKGEVPLPCFVLRPEGITDKLLDRIRHADIDFDSHPGFSDLYQLEAEDEAAVREFFATPLLDYLQQNPGYSVESAGRDVLVFRDHKRVANAADIDVQLRLAHTLYQRLLSLGRR